MNNEEFNALYKKGRDEGKISLRRYQWKSIKKGNVAMLIFIGKQLLGQRDDPEDMDKLVQPNPINIILAAAPTEAKPSGAHAGAATGAGARGDDDKDQSKDATKETATNEKNSEPVKD